MSVKPRDHRPKVISINTTLNGLSIASKLDVLWPCHAFNVTVPQKKKSMLNVFEKTVLKITEIESGNAKKIAQITCLEQELVVFILNRLKQLNLLNNRYELSKYGQEFLNEWRNKPDGNWEYTAATVFVDLLSGRLLPYVYTGQLSYKKISRIGSKGRIDFLTNPTKEKSKIYASKIFPGKNSFWKKVPTVNDIIRASREFKKRHKRFALLNRNVGQCPPLVPMAEAISINANPELVYLHCIALIQRGNPELLVTDGCGLGFSESFAMYLNSHDWAPVIELKRRGVIDNFDNVEVSDHQPKGRPFKYAEVSKRIKRSKSVLENIINLDVASTNYEREYRREIEYGIKSIYAALEWSFRQVVADNPAPEWERVFSTSKYQYNETLLVGFAKKVGFTINENNQSLLEVKAGAIRQIENGTVELQPLLALAIAGTSNNANHPVHRLAQNHPEFFAHALRLKKYRDPIEHGSTRNLDVDEDILQRLIETTESMIISLIPDVAVDLDNASKVPCARDVNQERLKANIALEKALGTAFVSTLTGDIKEQLIRSEIMLAQFSTEKSIEIIKCYAAVMQHALLNVIKYRSIGNKTDVVIDDAIERIVRFGFYSAPNAIPKEITTVNPTRFYRATQGLSTTLGAHLLVVFLLGSESELLALQKTDPNFVEFIANLIRLRGHGNRLRQDLSLKYFKEQKDKLNSNLKIISEVF